VILLLETWGEIGRDFHVLTPTNHQLVVEGFKQVVRRREIENLTGITAAWWLRT
jgi:hypothetical protein